MSRNFIDDQTKMVQNHLKIFNLIIKQSKENCHKISRNGTVRMYQVLEKNVELSFTFEGRECKLCNFCGSWIDIS